MPRREWAMSSGFGIEVQAWSRLFWVEADSGFDVPQVKLGKEKVDE